MKKTHPQTERSNRVTLADVYAAPGHLIRRCNQISVAIFFDEMKRTGLTPVQYAALVAIYERPDIDQRTLVDMIAIDRSTVGAMLQGLETKKLVSRTTPAHNQRIKQLRVLPAGANIIQRTQTEMARVQQRLLAPLTSEEREMFMALLSKVVQVNNEFSRVPLRRAPAPSSPEPRSLPVLEGAPSTRRPRRASR